LLICLIQNSFIHYNIMKKLLLTAGISFLLSLAAFAQEGMWLLTQLDQLKLAERGLQLGSKDIYNPDGSCLSRAILQIGGGTGSFVSPDGLVLTNHHVAYTAIQRASSTESDYLANGFLAKNRQDEIRAPGYKALIVTGIRDVTDEVLAAVKDISDPVEKDKKTEEKIKEIREKQSKDRKDVIVKISSMYNGRQFLEFTYREFKDMRIVYAPPSSIGNYGGETDNWMWPRHTGDFSFLRVYVAPDGSSREYDPANVPYKPEVWLKTAKDGVKEGDITFILGFPGFTTRYRSATSVYWNQEINYPFTIENFGEIISLIEDLTKNDPAGRLKTASLVKGLANTLKNYQGKVEGMKKTHFLQEKKAFEKEFLTWANSRKELKEKYAGLLDREREAYLPLEKTRERDQVAGLFGGLAGTLCGIAEQLYTDAMEIEKAGDKPDEASLKKKMEKISEQLTYAFNDYDEPVDKALFARALGMAGRLPADQRIPAVDRISEKPGFDAANFTEKAYSVTKLKDPEYVKSLIGKTPKELEQSGDPFLLLAAGLYPLNEEINKTQSAFAATVIDIRRQYMEALYEWKGKAMYPDANGTIRFTSGKVKGYKPRNAVWYEPFTSLAGVVEKHNGKEPFNAPEALIRLSRDKDYGRWSDKSLNDVPLAFLSLCDITGGNSGSPVMNAKGELAGVVFDGNYEAMISDWQYDENLQRSITCDIRYVLFVTEKFAGATHLLKEMQIR